MHPYYACPCLGVPLKTLASHRRRPLVLLDRPPSLLETDTETVDDEFPDQADGRTRWFDWYRQPPNRRCRAAPPEHHL